MKPSFAFLTALSLMLPLAACSSGQSGTGNPSSSAHSMLGGLVDRALDKADAELTTQTITISDSNVPRAEITPQGDFLIAGKPVSLTPQQRASVLAYRRQLIAIGQQGIALGKQGAALGKQGAVLGMHAASEALAGAFSSQSEQQIHRQVESQATGVRQAAAKICDELPALRSSQQRLAADLPAFKPYADLTPAKIEECRKDANRQEND